MELQFNHGALYVREKHKLSQVVISNCQTSCSLKRVSVPNLSRPTTSTVVHYLTAQDCSTVKDGATQPLSLYALCHKFVALNIHLLESVDGLPSSVAEVIVSKSVDLGSFTKLGKMMPASCSKLIDLLNAEYREEVLENLALGSKLPETCSESLGLPKINCLHLFYHLKHVDLSNCHLGDSESLLKHIFSLESLHVLLVRDNRLTDAGIQKLTAPIRFGKHGCSQLKMLDLSDNPLTDRSVRFLKCLNTLTLLCTTGSYIAETCVARELGMGRDVSTCLPPVTTTGWLAPVVTEWFSEDNNASAKSTAVRSFYGKRSGVGKKPCKKCQLSTSHRQQVIFTRILSATDVEAETKASHTSSQGGAERSVDHTDCGMDLPLQTELESSHSDKRNASKPISRLSSATRKRDTFDDELLSLYGGSACSEPKKPKNDSCFDHL